MRSKKILKPGQPGTKKWLKKYGEDLYRVRYRYDALKKERVTTIEIIVDKADWERKKGRIPKNKMMKMDVRFEETYLRNLIRSAGGYWDKREKVWKLAYGEIISLGLTKRMIKDQENNS